MKVVNRRKTRSKMIDRLWLGTICNISRELWSRFQCALKKEKSRSMRIVSQHWCILRILFYSFSVGDTVFVQGAAATPTKLVSALAQYGKSSNLENVQVCSMHTEGLAEYTDPSLEKVFRSVSFFMGGNVRKAVSEGRADAVPIFLHEIPKLFHQKIYRPDVSFISVSRNIPLNCWIVDIRYFTYDRFHHQINTDIVH